MVDGAAAAATVVAAGAIRASLVVVPRTMAIQNLEISLSHLALVATITGNRPFVSTAMIQDTLFACFQINAEDMDIKVHEPEDFLVRFSHREDRDRVLSVFQALGSPHAP